MFGQIAYFTSLGRSIGPNDLVMLSYVRNDIGRYAPLAGSALATAVTGYLKTDVTNLIALGGRNFILFGDDAPNDATYTAALGANLPGVLAPLANKDVHIRILDLDTLMQRVSSTPQMYGFLPGDCVDVPGCPTAALTVQNQYAMPSGHPSDSFSLVLARYINNLLTSADGIAAQADISAMQVNGFTNSLAERLDLTHIGTGNPYNLLNPVSSVEQERNTEARSGGVNYFVIGSYEHGRRDDRTNASGYNYNTGGVIVGAEYSANRNFLLGLAFSYAKPTADLNNGVGSIASNFYLLGGYASLSYPHWFADLIINGGIDDFQLSRPGIIDELRATTSGYIVAPSFKAGYLFGASQIQIGPIAGLSYTRAHIGAYTEQGDAVLTQAVSSQDFNSLDGEAGIQLRKSLAFYGPSLSWFLNVTAVHEFLDGARTLTTVGTDPTSAIPVYTSVSGGEATYGQIAGGFSANFLEWLRLSLHADKTFARRDGDAYSINGELTIRL